MQIEHKYKTVKGLEQILNRAALRIVMFRLCMSLVFYMNFTNSCFLTGITILTDFLSIIIIKETFHTLTLKIKRNLLGGEKRSAFMSAPVDFSNKLFYRRTFMMS